MAFIAVILALIVLVVWLEKRSINKVAQARKQLAERLGLVFDRQPGEPGRISGMLDSHPVTVTAERVGKQQHTTIVTELNPPLDLGLKIESRGIGAGLLESVGAIDGLKTGDQTFDEMFLVTSDRPEVALEVLGPAVRASLMRCWSTLPQVVEDFGLTAVVPSWSEDTELIERVLRAQTSVATVLRGESAAVFERAKHHEGEGGGGWMG